MSATVDLIGWDELIEDFAKAPDLIHPPLKQGVDNTAAFAEGVAKREAPIQYGQLRGSIHREAATITDNNVEAIVGTNVAHAKWQEEGTGIYAGHDMIRPKTAKVLAWKQNGQMVFAKAIKGVRPHWFFRKAKEQAQPYMADQMERALITITRALKGGL